VKAEEKSRALLQVHEQQMNMLEMSKEKGKSPDQDFVQNNEDAMLF
jgi:hypothetical protein